MEESIYKPVPDFVYLTVPAQWLPTYHRLLKGIAKYGIDAIKDCDAACKGDRLYVIQCWNVFQSAIAAKSIGDEKAAKVMIEYINAQLDLLKIKSKVKIVVGKDNRVYCSADVDDEIKYFIVDPSTGNLYEHVFDGDNNNLYSVDADGHLIEEPDTNYQTQIRLHKTVTQEYATKDDIEKLNSRVTLIEENLTRINSKIQSLNNTINNINNEVNSIKTSIQRFNNDILSLKENINHLDSRMTLIEDTVKEMNIKINSFDNKYATKTELSVINDKINLFDSKYATKIEVSAINDKINQLMLILNDIAKWE